MAKKQSAASTAIKPSRETADSFFSVYEEYAKTLRAWFITLGAGGPGFLVAQPAIAAKVQSAGSLGRVISLFLVGIGIQVVLVFLNKAAAWINYSSFEPTMRKRPGPQLRAFADWVSEQFMIDILVDLLTTILFMCAVVLIVRANL